MIAQTENSQNKSQEAYTKYLRQGFIALFILVVCLGGWAAIFKIKGAVIASGVVVVEGEAKTLQHLDGGIVGEILVENGDIVKKGQVMVRLNPTAMEANRTIVEKRLFEAQARIDRLRTEWDEAKEISWSKILRDAAARTDVAEILTGQQKLFEARKKSMNGQVAQLRQRIAQSREQIQGLRNLIVSKQSQISLIGEELEGLRTLLEKGYVSKTRVLALEREQARLEGDISTHRSDISRTNSAIGETEIQILQIKKDATAEILTELRQVESERSDLSEQLITASDQFERIDIISPVAGIVHDMSVTTIGGVITPGQPIMQIIPINDRLIIEARIRPIDIDQVYVGQPARINLSAFSQRTTPQLDGFVINTSADSLIDQVTGAPYFSVSIEIPAGEKEKLGDLTLIPGMPAESFIQTEERTVLNYILKPFSEQLGRSLREE
jgi:membrane fusion protein, type I secretion system